jgi:tRNA-dihydrouridine synthase
VAQIYGHRPEDFYRATHVICELGFDGVDINMGCPARKVVSRSCGAGMIQDPDLAHQVIKATRQAILDWSEGQRLEDLALSAKLTAQVRAANHLRGCEQPLRRRIPYSVKTRLGFDRVIIEDWVTHLLEEQPAVISIHGRTLKQMYKGEADWEAITRAARMIKETDTLCLGNGDITSLAQADRWIEESAVDGVLIGRASLGNPWIFRNQAAVSPVQRISMALEHMDLLQDTRGDRIFPSIKRHLKGYLHGFRGAATLRRQAMLTRSFEELRAQLEPFTQKRRAGSSALTR